MTHPRLRDDVSLLVGMDNRPLAYDPVTGRYHRLSGAAVATLRLLDGSRSVDAVAGELAARRRQQTETVRAELDAFLAQLTRAGLLTGTTPPVRPPTRRTLMPRFVVTRRLPDLLEPLAARLRSPGRARVAVGLLTVAGILGTGYGVVGVFVAAPTYSWSIATAVAVLVLLLQVCVHESAHALVAQVLRAPVRGAGFALLLWVLPVAYVDRTDVYRIRGRGARVFLALAGPLCDGVFMGGYAAVAAYGDGLPAAVATQLLLFNLFTLFLNVNPLLPSDGYVAAEAAFGLVDPRGRAFALVAHLVSRRPLPPHLASLSRRARWALLGYGVACTGYLLLIMYVTLASLVILIGRAVVSLV